MSTITAPQRPHEGILRELELADLKARCVDDPKALIGQMSGFDPTLQEWFSFEMEDPDADWGWQSLVIDWWMNKLTPEGEAKLAVVMGWWEGVDPKLKKFVILKARQLGITWCAVALGLWFILYKPGSNVVAYSHGLDEAKKLIQRAWVMFLSIPEPLRSHVEILSPERAELPSEKIVLRDKKTGKISTFQALPDTEKAGHGDTITLGIMDELARMKYARGIYTAVNPATSRGGRLIMISTANGVSNRETGDGNFFHHLWVTRKAKRLSAAFLPWNAHPERDDEWYETEAMAMDHMERNQQYPLNPDNAFILSGDLYFDPDALQFYRAEGQRRPLYRGQFDFPAPGSAKFVNLGAGPLSVFAQPIVGRAYGISADIASGRSQDYSVAHVIDMESGEIAAKLRAKMDIPAFANQLKALGHWYGKAKIIPERTGIGEALIVALRSSNDGHKPYSNLYQHQRDIDIGRSVAESFGFPMGQGTRATVLEGLRSTIKRREIPFLDENDVDELQTFIYRETTPSPRAMDGCNDDSVMSLALARYLFSLRGTTATKPLRKSRWRKQKYNPPPTRMGV